MIMSNEPFYKTLPGKAVLSGGAATLIGVLSEKFVYKDKIKPMEVLLTIAAGMTCVGGLGLVALALANPRPVPISNPGQKPKRLASFSYDSSFDQQEGTASVHVLDSSGDVVGYAAAVVGSTKRIASYLQEQELSYPRRLTGKHVAYISGVEIDDEPRSLGYGAGMLMRLFSLLKQTGVEVVYLHAHDSESGWRRAGFKQIDTGDYMVDSSMPFMSMRLSKTT